MVDLSKRLQVFVSSTYIDLIEERQAAVQAILEAKHIPAGMELFTAGDQSQWEVIKHWIDQSDVYLLILGGRYGSIDKETGKSYTHLEYEYALEREIPLFSCVLRDPDKRAMEKGDIKKYLERENPTQYEEFKNLVMSKMINFWENSQDIEKSIILTLKEFEKQRDLIGWVKGDQQISSPLIEEEKAKLTQEKKELEQLLEVLEGERNAYSQKLAQIELQKEQEKQSYQKEIEQLQQQLNKKDSIINQLQKEIQQQESNIPQHILSTHSVETAKTVIINETGEVVKKQTIKAYYYDEILENNTEQDNLSSIRMIYIPEGQFFMGTPDKEIERLYKKYNIDDFYREKPQHLVKVRPFYLSQTPITQAQWKAIAAMPQVGKELTSSPSRFTGDKRPVESINWHDAIEFCARLSVYTKRNYRLPSEAEWEYSCRAGTTTPFHFGETISTDLANYNGLDGEYGAYGKGKKGINRKETTDVDLFRVANNFGLNEMHGNVWEWCLDPWHENYDDAPTDGRVWDEENQQEDYYEQIVTNIEQMLIDERRRVLRGGSWLRDPNECRSAYRGHGNLRLGTIIYGFRVVCSSFKNITV